LDQEKSEISNSFSILQRKVRDDNAKMESPEKLPNALRERFWRDFGAFLEI
jgi:hypothetical protein